MRSAKYLAAGLVLLAANTAQAQSIDATPTGYGEIAETAVVPFSTTLPRGYNVINLGGRGGSVESIVEIGASQVSFESGVAVSGAFSTATSYSGVDVTITNLSDGLLAISDFESTIIPAGMGFYLQERAGAATDNNIFTGYGQTFSGLTFEDLSTHVEAYSPFAYADFDFSVVSNDVTLYSLSGWISLAFDSEGNVIQNYNLDVASAALDGFVLAFGSETLPNQLAWAYAWDSTNIVLPLNALLESGQSQVIQYRTSVTAYTRSDCITATTCLVAYSGFGDPIGRGGGVEFESFAAMRGFGALDAEPKYITGINFSPQFIDPVRLTDGGGVVPEPSTWAFMIFGFGFAGAALRRRRTLSYI
ncbi:PEPxxWA-CTERM sorting domain-containing protein [Phenylobacterium sp.]|uniref:PEPxxWA-CTERM sorting domain-containing protein n=1 Tax=Phenylobacterium sp. TaxID=1871053 RepID=UPI00301DCDF4